MPHTLQDFLVTATQKAAGDLAAALLRLPEDQRNVSPMGQARTPLDLVAECAVLNGTTADMIDTRQFPTDFDPAAFEQKKVGLSQDWEALRSLLEVNTERAITAIRTIHDEDLASEIAMPWGAVTLAQLAAYPYWNMSYHEGQINYVASMLGCLP